MVYGLSVSEVRRQAREADERQGTGCAHCVWGTWFDEAVDFGWWCDKRDEFIGDQVRCADFSPKAGAPSAG